MRYIKLSLLVALIMALVACSTTHRSKLNVANGQPENITVTNANDANDTAEAPPAKSTTPSIVDTQSADLAAKLGTPANKPSTTPTAPQTPAPQPSGAQSVTIGGQQGLALSLSYQQAWSQVKKALPQAGYPIMEQDNTSGTYYILDKVGSGGTIKRDTPIYQLHLQKAADTQTTITLSNAQNQPVAANVAERVLGAIKNKLAL